MAEFVEVMRQRDRMCKTVDCSTCRLHYLNNGTDTGCGDFTEEHPQETERIVMEWAKANPEPKPPKYPTWFEYFRDNKYYPIPEAIAKQLGLEPIK